jgi:hypothetical protein
MENTGEACQIGADMTRIGGQFFDCLGCALNMAP